MRLSAIVRVAAVAIVATAAIAVLSSCDRVKHSDADVAGLEQQLQAEKTQTANLLFQLQAATAATVTAVPDDRPVVTVIGGACYTGRTLVDANAGIFYPEIDPNAVPIQYMTRGVQGSLCFPRASDCIKNARVGAPLPLQCSKQP